MEDHCCEENKRCEQVHPSCLYAQQEDPMQQDLDLEDFRDSVHLLSGGWSESITGRKRNIRKLCRYILQFFNKK